MQNFPQNAWQIMTCTLISSSVSKSASGCFVFMAKFQFLFACQKTRPLSKDGNVTMMRLRKHNDLYVISLDNVVTCMMLMRACAFGFLGVTYSVVQKKVWRNGWMNKDISLRNKHFETRAGLILQTTLNHTFDQSITKVQMPKRMGCKSLVQMHIVLNAKWSDKRKFSHENWYNPTNNKYQRVEYFELNEYENLSSRESKFFIWFCFILRTKDNIKTPISIS